MIKYNEIPILNNRFILRKITNKNAVDICNNIRDKSISDIVGDPNNRNCDLYKSNFNFDFYSNHIYQLIANCSFKYEKDEIRIQITKGNEGGYIFADSYDVNNLAKNDDPKFNLWVDETSILFINNKLCDTTILINNSMVYTSILENSTLLDGAVISDSRIHGNTVIANSIVDGSEIFNFGASYIIDSIVIHSYILTYKLNIRNSRVYRFNNDIFNIRYMSISEKDYNLFKTPFITIKDIKVDKSDYTKIEFLGGDDHAYIVFDTNNEMCHFLYFNDCYHGEDEFLDNVPDRIKIEAKHICKYARKILNKKIKGEL